jgi:phosphomannomutase
MYCCLFDVDGTLTPSRLAISEETKQVLQQLKESKKVACVAIVGGSNMEKQKEQLGEDVLAMFDYVFSENGLVAFHQMECFHQQSLLKKIGEENYKRLVNQTLKVLADTDIPVKRGTFIELRTGMVNVCPIGRSCNLSERIDFYNFDLKHKVRDTIAAKLSQSLAELNLRFVSGGQISLDVFPKGWDKRYCLQHMDTTKFSKIFFFGDRTDPGGNDHEIYRHLKGYRVTCPEDTRFWLEQMVLKDSPDLENFNSLYHQWRFQQDNIDWNQIKPVKPTDVIHYDSLPQPTQLAPDDLCVVKLNGGLGTSMGCTGPKCILKVDDDNTFLDIILEQSKTNQAKFALMNSFFTHHNQEMQSIIVNYQGVIQFQQSKFPRILEDSHRLLPCAEKSSGKAGYYPPGHGDIYRCLQREQIDSEYVFVSNCDNLDATYDPKIYAYLKQHPGVDFLMEMTAKTDADVKGGTVFQDENGLRLVEVAEVDDQNMEGFLSAPLFNTNNIWFKTAAIPKEMPLRVIRNKKSYGGLPIIQLETAMGDAIRFFKNPRILQVPRSRFSPVKKLCDLEALRKKYSQK